MLGIQPLIEYTKSKIRLSLVFEVVDDADDQSPHAALLKPVDVWFVFSKQSHELPLDLKSYRNAENDEVMFFPGLTKQTGRDLRQWASLDTTYDKHYVYVLAEPQKEWRHLYGTRQYKLRVSTGRAYNIAISLPPLSSSTTPPGDATDSRRVQKRATKLNL